MSDESEEPKLEPRRRRRARPSAPEPPAAEAPEEELPAVPHPSLLPARPGTPPPPPGPPGTFRPTPPAPVRRGSNAQLTLGVVLVVVGALALLNQFGLLWWVDGRLIWPVVLIAAGVILLYRRGLR